MKRLITGAGLLLVLIACNSAPEASSKPSSNKAAIAAPPHASLNLDNTEQIELFYYPDPEDRKSFRQLTLTDSILINVLRSNIIKDTIAHSECPHDVKMYFIRNGEVFKTVYGATSDSCRYFAYAINSNAFYTPMEESSFALLDSLRKSAK